MKKIYVLLFTVFLNSAFFSCTPTSNYEDESPTAETCCEEDGDLDPPPPPPTEDKTIQGSK